MWTSTYISNKPPVPTKKEEVIFSTVTTNILPLFEGGTSFEAIDLKTGATIGPKAPTIVPVN